MTELKADTLPILSESDIVQVRQAVRKLASECKFSTVELTKLVTAASELARNALKYGGGGKAEVAALEEAGRFGIRAIFSDQGPGIADLSLALSDGFTTGGGMGLGLGGSKRLVSEFRIESALGQGTTVTILQWKGR